MAKRVVVTGYGAVCSLGENSGEVWNAIKSYKKGYQIVDYPNSTIHSKFFGFVKKDNKRFDGFSKSILKLSPDFARYALVASREALFMAFGEGGYSSYSISPNDIGVVIGTGWGGLDHINQNLDDYRNTGQASTFTTLHSMHSIATAAVSLAWNLRGYQNSPVAACATGTIAIGDAFEIIRSGRQKMVLAGGSESLTAEFNVRSIDVMQALSKEQVDIGRASCPFDSNRSGFVLSEGAAVLFLEELEHALVRGARILGEITGYANYSDAFDMTAPAEDLVARVNTIEVALAQAALQPSDIDYINLHGTSTYLNDLNETNALKKALGAEAYNIPMSSTKSYTGHLIGAAGSMEAIFCLKAIEENLIPATINLNSPDPSCDLNYTPNVHVQKDQIDRALNLSFGFGGANAALVLERYLA